MRRRRKAQRGSIAVQVGLLSAVLIGFAALGTEVTLLFLRQRQMQSAADAAALSAAMALTSKHAEDYQREARAIAAASGFRDGAGGTRITVNGPHGHSTSAVEVIIAQPQTLTLLGLFMAGSIDVGARAVATAPPARLSE